MQKIRTSITLDLGDWKKLKQMAIDHRTSLNYLLNKLVKQSLEEGEK